MRQNQKKSPKIFFTILIALIALIVVAAGGAFIWYQSNLNQRNSSQVESVFTVAKGQTLDSIYLALQNDGFNINKTIWQVYLKLNPTLGDGIQAGDFTLKADMNIPEIVQALQKANINKGIKVTIQEGLRSDEIADILDKAFATADQTKRKFTKADYLSLVESPKLENFSSDVNEFLSQNLPTGKTLEGYLFPDTYYFDEAATAANIIDKQLLTLMGKLDTEDYQKIYESKYSFHEYMTIASLIERETLTVAERPIVADILYKRLENGVNGVKRLELCSTMLYIIKDWKADYKINEALKEQYKDNPYNTYRVAGLPPGPIANPGIVSIKAAIYPEANEYYFFLHDANGLIHYAKTYAEHNANIRKFL